MINFSSDKDQSLLEAVHRQAQLKSMSKARKWIKTGQVKVGIETIKIPSHPLKEGQVVSIGSQNLDRSKPIPTSRTLDIVHEEEAYLVVDKPAGIPVIAKEKGMDSLIGRLYRYRRPDQASKEDFYAITRLDKRESGLVLIAKAMESRNAFQEVGVKKRWYALVQGTIDHDDGRIEIPLKLNTIKLWTEATEKGVQAVTEYRVMKRGLGLTLLRVEALTDHKNQERAHLALSGYPIVGDKRYKSTSNLLKRMGMHLFSLRFEHPDTGREVEYKTRVPKVLLQQVKLRNK